MERASAVRLLSCLVLSGLLACPSDDEGGDDAAAGTGAPTEPTPCGDMECPVGQMCVIEDIFTPNEPPDLSYRCEAIPDTCPGAGDCECADPCGGMFCRCETMAVNELTCILDDGCGV